MSHVIHPTALIAKGARIADNASVGPFAIIGEHAVIGSLTRIDSFAQVLGHTRIGQNCHIFSHAVVGSIPQDKKFKGEVSFLSIGDKNTIREFTTINPGTDKDSETVIGSGNLFMAYSHVAHDCSIGNDNVFANNATLAGYVTVHDGVVIGGLSAVHQFCRIGSFSIIGGCSKVVQDVPPFSLCDGHPAVVRGLNLVGLRRRKFSSVEIRNLKKAFKILFFEKHPFHKAKEIMEDSVPSSGNITQLLQFVSSSKRGIGV